MIEPLLLILAGYFAVGAFFAIAFVVRGAAAIDTVAKDAPLRVKLIFFPGAVALWPMLALAWATCTPDSTNEDES